MQCKLAVTFRCLHLNQAIAGKAKAGMAQSDCGWTCGCAGKTELWDPLRTCAIPEHFWGDDSRRSLYQVYVPLALVNYSKVGYISVVTCWL